MYAQTQPTLTHHSLFEPAACRKRKSCESETTDNEMVVETTLKRVNWSAVGPDANGIPNLPPTPAMSDNLQMDTDAHMGMVMDTEMAPNSLGSQQSRNAHASVPYAAHTSSVSTRGSDCALCASGSQGHLQHIWMMRAGQ
ncbi:hypothetical protein HDU77_001331 [Chytriomyces hyalinus]|nr:hypothetical protein HDU77_001331 [Chytriomyces hyalinus]